LLGAVVVVEHIAVVIQHLVVVEQEDTDHLYLENHLVVAYLLNQQLLLL